MLLSSNMVTSNTSSLLESLHQLSNIQDTKLIFKTEMNSSLEIIRFKAPSKISLPTETPVFTQSSENQPEITSIHNELITPPVNEIRNENLNDNTKTSMETVTEEDRSHLPAVPERYKCGICTYKTNKKSNIDKHIKTVHLKEKSSCELCSKSFSNLPQHYRKQHSTTKSKLDKEKLGFNKETRTLVLDHIDIPALDQTENLFSTRQLSHESEDSSGDISPNLTIDEEILPLRPLLPSQIPLPGSGNVVPPFNSSHQINKDSFKRTVRSKSKSIISNNHVPINKNTAKKSEKCESSDFTPTIKRIKSLVKPKKRECTDCGKLFANLEQHIKIVHKKIKNFECVNCKRRFYDNRELRNHEFQSLLAGQCRQSNREGVAGGPRKQHACTYCTYSANRKSNLTLHIESVHLKIKYSCPACQLQVASKPNLSQHMKNCKKYLAEHPTEKDPRRILFHCKLCQYSTPRPSHYDRHVLSVHGTEALETVTSVYEASTKSQKGLAAPNSKVPFKIPQFYNLVNLETVEGFNLDYILEDKDFFSSSDLQSDQHFINTDHQLQDHNLPGSQIPVQNVLENPNRSINLDTNTTNRLINSEDLDTVIVRSNALMGTAGLVDPTGLVDSAGMVGPVGLVDSAGMVTSTQDHLNEEGAELFVHIEGNSGVTPYNQLDQVSSLIKLSSQQLQYQQIQGNYLSHHSQDTSHFHLHSNKFSSPQLEENIGKVSGSREILVQVVPNQRAEHTTGRSSHHMKSGGILSSEHQQVPGHMNEDHVLQDDHQYIKKVSLNDLDDLVPFNSDQYEFKTKSFSQTIPPALEETHILRQRAYSNPSVHNQEAGRSIQKRVDNHVQIMTVTSEPDPGMRSQVAQLHQDTAKRLKPRVSDYMLSGARASPPLPPSIDQVLS